MDVLGNVLLSLRLRDSSIGIFELAAPWAFELPLLGQELAFTYSPIDGPMWLDLDGHAAVRLEPGDSALVFGSVAHRLRSAPGVRPMSLEVLWAERGLPTFGPDVHRTGPLRLAWAPTDAGADAPVTRLLTLAVQLADVDHHPLLAILPRMIVLRQSAGRLFPWLPSTLQFLAAEETATTPGYTATASHLATLIVTSFIRAHAVDATADQAGWVRGLSDPRIGRALACIHARPGEPWTAASLAREANMSRATFARRFTALIGQPPIEYLVDCRMQSAAERLLSGRESVAEIARSACYRSEWAFRQAFTSRFGLPPLRFVKSRRAATAAER